MLFFGCLFHSMGLDVLPSTNGSSFRCGCNVVTYNSKARHTVALGCVYKRLRLCSLSIYSKDFQSKFVAIDVAGKLTPPFTADAIVIFLPTSMPISKTRWRITRATTILGVVYSTCSQCNAFLVHKSDTILTRPTLVYHRSWWMTKSFLRAQRPRVNICTAVNISLGGLGSSCTASSESCIYVFLWGPHASMCLCIFCFIHKAKSFSNFTRCT